MTPRTIESDFSEELLKQVKDEFPLDLTLEAPIMNQLHPKLIWAKLQFQYNPQQDISVPPISDWNADFFMNLNEAEVKYPNIGLVFEARPWSFYKFLQADYDEAIIDFPPLGTIVVSKKELQSKRPELHHQLLSLWMNYALSPELWGTHGKWPRFHARLHQLFKEHHLLNGEVSVGYYPLVEKAKNLESLGFIGTNLEKSYVLVLPWTFSLSALEKLEEIIRQEF